MRTLDKIAGHPIPFLRRSALPLLALLAFALLPGSAFADAITHTRAMDAYYGTATVRDAGGNLLSTQDFLELTDHVTGTLAGDIFNDLNVDARVRNNLGPWVNAQADIEWVLGTPEGLPAGANLWADLTSIPGQVLSQTDTGTMDRGTATYTLASWYTDGGTGGGSSIAIYNIGNAEVHFYERDYTKAVAASPAPVPEPSTMLLMGSGLVGLIGYGRRQFRK